MPSAERERAPERVFIYDEGSVLGWCVLDVPDPAGRVAIDSDTEYVEYVRADLVPASPVPVGSDAAFEPGGDGHDDRAENRDLDQVESDVLLVGSALVGHASEREVGEDPDGAGDEDGDRDAFGGGEREGEHGCCSARSDRASSEALVPVGDEARRPEFPTPASVLYEDNQAPCAWLWTDDNALRDMLDALDDGVPYVFAVERKRARWTTDEELADEDLLWLLFGDTEECDTSVVYEDAGAACGPDVHEYLTVKEAAAAAVPEGDEQAQVGGGGAAIMSPDTTPRGNDGGREPNRSGEDLHGEGMAPVDLAGDRKVNASRRADGGRGGCGVDGGGSDRTRSDASSDGGADRDRWDGAARGVAAAVPVGDDEDVRLRDGLAAAYSQLTDGDTVGAQTVLEAVLAGGDAPVEKAQQAMGRLACAGCGATDPGGEGVLGAGWTFVHEGGFFCMACAPSTPPLERVERGGLVELLTSDEIVNFVAQHDLVRGGLGPAHQWARALLEAVAARLSSTTSGGDRACD